MVGENGSMTGKKSKRSKRQESLQDKVFHLVVVGLSVFILLVIAYPVYFVLIASISNPAMVSTGQVVWFPRGINLYGYGKVFQNTKMWTGYMNTIIYALAGTLVNLAVTLPAAYALSRKEFAARKILNLFFVFTMFFSGGLIATYLVIKELGMINSRWVFIIPFCVNVYNMIIARSFFESSLPEELREAAVLDGCSHFQYFCKVVLPLSKAVISVVALYYLVAHWNDFFTGLLYIHKEKLLPLQNVLRSILLISQTGGNGGAGATLQQSYADQIKYAIIIVSTLPVIVIYPFVQKYFEKGVMIGAVKG